MQPGRLRFSRNLALCTSPFALCSSPFALCPLPSPSFRNFISALTFTHSGRWAPPKERATEAEALDETCCATVARLIFAAALDNCAAASLDYTVCKHQRIVICATGTTSKEHRIVSNGNSSNPNSPRYGDRV